MLLGHWGKEHQEEEADAEATTKANQPEPAPEFIKNIWSEADIVDPRPYKMTCVCQIRASPSSLNPHRPPAWPERAPRPLWLPAEPRTAPEGYPLKEARKIDYRRRLGLAPEGYPPKRAANVVG